MRALIRVDASLKIGVGHVARCLTLANRLKTSGVEVFFACRNIIGHQESLIIQHGFHLYLFDCHQVESETFFYDQVADFKAMLLSLRGNLSFDWVVVDHYKLDAQWEQLASKIAKKIFVIDDLANRNHVSDVLLDQNYFTNAQSRYQKKTPVWGRKFIGEQYALLRDEFLTTKIDTKKASEKKRILVSFGGTDPQELTIKILKLLSTHFKNIYVDILLSGKVPNQAAISHLCKIHPHFYLHINAENVAYLMAKADLAVGAGGITTYERIFMHLPSLIVSVAENQYLPLLQMSEVNTLYFLGRSEDVTDQDWLIALQSWFDDKLKPLNFLKVASRSNHVTNSMGVELLPFSDEHIEKTFTFIQDPVVQNQFSVKKPLDWNTHLSYWNAKLKNNKEVVFAICYYSKHIGNCGLKPLANETEYEAWIYIGDSSARSLGLGETAFCFLLKHAFEKIKLERIYIFVLDKNIKAISLYKKLGFVCLASGDEVPEWHSSQQRVSKWMLAK